MSNPRITGRSLAGLVLAAALALAYGDSLPAAIPPGFGPAVHAGDVKVAELEELSGMDHSLVEDELLWAITDDKAEKVFALDHAGNAVGAVAIAGAKNNDWEDIASFELDGRPYLMIADTGGNKFDRARYVLTVIEEPVRDSVTGRFPASVEPAWSIEFSYEGMVASDAVNCEAVAVDVAGRKILLLTKEDKESQPARLYELPLAAESNRSAVARLTGRVGGIVELTEEDEFRASKITALDISGDGRLAVALTKGDAYAFARAEGEDWRSVFARRPERVRLPPMPQAESLCFDRVAAVIFISSERDNSERYAPLFRVAVEGGEGKSSQRADAEFTPEP